VFIGCFDCLSRSWLACLSLPPTVELSAALDGNYTRRRSAASSDCSTNTRPDTDDGSALTSQLCLNRTTCGGLLRRPGRGGGTLSPRRWWQGPACLSVLHGRVVASIVSTSYSAFVCLSLLNIHCHRFAVLTRQVGKLSIWRPPTMLNEPSDRQNARRFLFHKNNFLQFD